MCVDLTVLGICQQEDVGMLQIVRHHGHQAHHTHTLARRRLELRWGEKKKQRKAIISRV